MKLATKADEGKLSFYQYLTSHAKWAANDALVERPVTTAPR